MTILVTRQQLAKAMPNADQTTLLAFEQLFQTFPATAKGAALSVAATQALNDATVVTLSPNDALSSERVLALDPEAFAVSDGGAGGELAISLLSSIAATMGFRLSFNLLSDTYLDLPTMGRLLESTLGGVDYAGDIAASAGGVAIGEVYKVTGGALAWRQV